MIRLHTRTTTEMDLDGFNFYVEAGRDFYLSDYCEAYGLNGEIHAQDVADVHEEVGKLKKGQFLYVTHEIYGYYGN